MEKPLTAEQVRNIELVTAIRKYELLFNTSLLQYYSRVDQEKAWYQLALELQDTAIACKERWRSIRVSFCRFLRTRQDGASKRGNYYLSSYLDFLEPFTKLRGKQGPRGSGPEATQPAEQSEAPDVVQLSDDERCEIKSERSEQGEASHDLFPLVIEGPSSRIEPNLASQLQLAPGHDRLGATANPEETPLPDCDLPVYEQRFRYSATEELPVKRFKSEAAYDNIHQNFFKSITPDLDRMSDRQIMKFKRGVLELIDNILYGDS